MTRDQWSVKVELFPGHCVLRVSESAQFRKSISEVLPLVKDIPVRTPLYTCHLIAADAFQLGCFLPDVYTVGEERIQNTEYRIQKTEYRRQNTEDRIQKTEYRRQETGGRRQEAE